MSIMQWQMELFFMTNKRSPWGTEETTALGIPLTGDYYYNFLNSKVKLTETGLFILDSLKGNQFEGKSSIIDEDQSSDAGPRHVSTIG